jgi:single-strand DNA-binding protein
MATDINSVVLVGNLTRDAEMTYANSGTAICKFAIANNYSRKQGDSWQDETNFFDCVLFGRRGEALQRYLTKGQKVGVQGVLRQDRWESDGQKRSRVQVVVNELNLLGGSGGASGSNSGGGAPRSSGGASQQAPSQDYGSGSDFEDDVPF